MNRARRFLTLTFLLLAIFIALSFSVPRAVAPISVRFLGYTNDDAGALHGTFRIQNTGSNTLIIGRLCPEFFDGPGALPSPAGRGRWKACGPHIYWWTITVGPNSSQTVTSPVPPNGKFWRLPVSYWNSGALGVRLGQWSKRLNLTKKDFYFCPTIMSTPIAPKLPLPPGSPYRQRSKNATSG
jgi:hypothetical protein